MECKELKQTIRLAMNASSASLPPPLPPVKPHPRSIVLSKIQRRRSPTEPPPVVQILCPQHSGCTWFVSTLCAYFPRPMTCVPDFADCWGRVPIRKGPKRPHVIKTTILPERTLAG